MHYSSIFRSADGIRADIAAIREALFEFSLDDAELFSQQVSRIGDIDRLRAVVTALSTARELHDLIRLGGFEELAGLLEFDRLRTLHIEARNALAALNLKQQIEDAHDTSGLLTRRWKTWCSASRRSARAN